MSPIPPARTVVLLGAGHTHLHILEKWRSRKIPNSRLVCVSNFPIVAYSGMLTGTLAGLYKREEMEIDLAALCQRSGVEFIQGRVRSIDSSQKNIEFANGSSVRFDVLSIGIGSVPDTGLVKQWGPEIVSLKPMQTLLDRLEDWSRRFRCNSDQQTQRVAIIGAGAAGVEVAFCLPVWLQRNGCESFKVYIVDSNSEVAAEMPRKVRRIIQKELSRRGVRMLLGKPIQSVEPGRVAFPGAATYDFDLIVMATSAVGSKELREYDLPLTDRGFVRTTSTLQVEGDMPILAVGDCGTITDCRVPKAGVYAVRQGPILWENLNNLLEGRELVNFVPQRGFLKLLCTGDGKAILSYGVFGFYARWCWKLKDRIDRGFIKNYQR